MLCSVAVFLANIGGSDQILGFVSAWLLSLQSAFPFHSAPHIYTFAHAQTLKHTVSFIQLSI